jgi:hypothetical protein
MDMNEKTKTLQNLYHLINVLKGIEKTKTLQNLYLINVLKGLGLYIVSDGDTMVV